MSNCLNCQYYDDCIKYFETLPESHCERYKFDENKPKKSRKKRHCVMNVKGLTVHG